MFCQRCKVDAQLDYVVSLSDNIVGDVDETPCNSVVHDNK